MDPGDPKPNFEGVVDSVMLLFGEVMTREAVRAIVEHYGGDLDQSIDAIMNMGDDQVPIGEMIPTTPPSQSQNIATVNQNTASIGNPVNMAAATRSHPVSYATASQSRIRPRHQPNPRFPKPRQTNMKVHNMWTLQMKQIVDYHNAGSRTLIILRGAPGSGKSYLAKQLLQAMSTDAMFETHIFSTDDFFYDQRGNYKHNKFKLPEAHSWNQGRSIKAMRQGVSPIFIDNTNIEIWEMQPYVTEGVLNGYIIEVLEPNTPWAKRANILASKNTHDVPVGAIRRMLDNFQNGLSGLFLIRNLGLIYPLDKKPPVLRDWPPIFPRKVDPPPNSPQSTIPNPHLSQPQQEHTSQAALIESNIAPTTTTSVESVMETPVPPIDTAPLQPITSHVEIPRAVEESMTVSNDDTQNADSGHNTAVDDLANRFEEIEHAWDNGESWNDGGEENARARSQDTPSYTPQPPRPGKSSVTTNKLLPSTADYSDWSNISMFMPAWNEYQNARPQASPTVRAETATKSTMVELGDVDTNNKNLKILVGTPKDINFYYIESNEEKIPEKRMLDKSSMTHDEDHASAGIPRCKNEEKHFEAFRKLFKNVCKVELRDIFDKCVGDVNWAVDIVLDGMANDQFQTIDSDDISDSDDTDHLCDCLAAYNIIPNVNTNTMPIASNQLPEPEPTAGPSTSGVKSKKEKLVLESSIQLKRQIEKNVVISDSHYSDHCLKIRKMRRGEENYTRADSPVEEPGTSASSVPNTNTVAETASVEESDEESSSSVSDEGERTVNVDLGAVFINELDCMFGRDNMYYPENVETRVNMPVSLLNEINALWVESLMYQLDQQSRQSEEMLRQDEEFARQVALKEEELAKSGQEPPVPDLKEIMDMELALTIYKKEVTLEWRNNESNDLAARMTREKLYNLFPDVQAEVLDELLMAHHNNFQATVEVLLSSTGNAEVLDDPNGVNKFVAKKELERQKILLAEQKEALSEVEWPLLPKDAKIDMMTVQKYRAKASEHLNRRNMYYQKANEFINTDMTQVATYYSDMAVLHKKKYDQANSLAAASLMQFHAANNSDNATIDLHFLHVPEAKETLDLFIDSHIKKLRDMQGRQGPRFHSLFFITGRGLHSRGGPKIKPAVKRRLKERGIAFSERNPGLLASKVCAADKMTYELP